MHGSRRTRARRGAFAWRSLEDSLDLHAFSGETPRSVHTSESVRTGLAEGVVGTSIEAGNKREWYQTGGTVRTLERLVGESSRASSIAQGSGSPARPRRALARAQEPSGPWSSSKSSVSTPRKPSSSRETLEIFSIAYSTVEWSRPPK
jgi:hypothetical protein